MLRKKHINAKDGWHKTALAGVLDSTSAAPNGYKPGCRARSAAGK